MTGFSTAGDTEGHMYASALLSLPPELLLKILVEFGLTARDLANVDLTCSRFSNHVEDEVSLTEDAARLVISRFKKPWSRHFRPGRRGSSWKECLHHIEWYERYSLLASGSFQNIWRTPDRKVLTWGAGLLGQLGSGQLEDSPRLQDISSQLPPEAGYATQVSAGSAHTAVVTASGSVFVFGDGRYGQLGTPATKVQRIPSPVSALASVPIMQVACGGNHTLFLSYEGLAYSVGYGESGQLGLGPGIYHRQEPMQVPLTKHRISQISVGMAFSVFVTDQGRILTCGGSGFGQLGHGGTKDLFTPTLIATLMDKSIVCAAAGVNHTLCIDSHGSVYSFGNGCSGQLGHGDYQTELVPRRVEAFEMFDIRVQSVAAGYCQSVFVTEDGVAYWCGACWCGSEINGYSHSHDPNSGFRATLPTCIHLEEPVQHAALGDTHGVLVTRDGRVLTAGGCKNERGQAGLKHGPVDQFLPISLELM